MIDGAFFDNSIDLNSDGYNSYKWDMKKHSFDIENIHNNIKNFVFIRGVPYCKNTLDDTLYKVNSIHFHGCKNIMATMVKRAD